MTSSLPSIKEGLPADVSLLVTYLARDRAFKGIGPKRARAMGDIFGSDLKTGILTMDERVIEIIGEESAIIAAAVMEVRQAETTFISWLDEIGANVPSSKAIRLARAWGPQGIETVRKNPYLLLAVSDWDSVDSIGRAMGVANGDLRRDQAALEAALTGEGCLGQGSTRMTRDAAQNAAQKYLGRPLAQSAIDAALVSGAAVQIAQELQPPGAAHMEAECALRLTLLAAEPPVAGLTPDDEIERLLINYQLGQPFPLTEPQRDAIRLAHRHRLLIIGGYAGSGKTTVLRGVCDSLDAIGCNALIVTLSGRAAKRATEATGRRAITIARFLIEVEKSDQQLGSDTALIVDEASMLGLVEIWRILRRLGDARLLLCGDPAQLPPVSPGLVFHHLAKDDGIQKVILDQVHRQDEATGIPIMSQGVRRGQIAQLPSFIGATEGVTFTECSRSHVAQEVLRIGSILRHGDVTRENIQIIAPTNVEIDHINQFFHNMRMAQNPRVWPGLGHIAEGEPVIWTGKNELERGLANGSLGRVKTIMRDTILVELDGEEHALSLSDGPSLQLAYAISVHKAQGSQWRKVIVPVFRSRVVDRSMIYTALTRAQDQVILVGDWQAIITAVCQRPSAERRSCGFPDWLTLARGYTRGPIEVDNA